MDSKALARFESKYVVAAEPHPILGTPCWLWDRYININGSGYGTFSIVSRKRSAHVVAYEHHVGPVPDSTEIDHLCRVRRCVNPAHLEAVTHRVNTLRGNSPPARCARATHCTKGHAFDVVNTGNDRGRRYCRQCNRDNSRANKRVENGWPMDAARSFPVNSKRPVAR